LQETRQEHFLGNKEGEHAHFFFLTDMYRLWHTSSRLNHRLWTRWLFMVISCPWIYFDSLLQKITVLIRTKSMDVTLKLHFEYRNKIPNINFNWLYHRLIWQYHQSKITGSLLRNVFRCTPLFACF
jgi:hypothetical protein